MILQMFALEIHEDQTFIRLRDAILQTAFDFQFFALGRQHPVGQNCRCDFDFEKLHQRAKSRGDDARTARHPDAARNRGLVANRKIALRQPNLVRRAIIVEFFQRSLDQTQAAIITETAHIARERIERIEAHVIFDAGQNLQRRPFIKHDRRGKIAHRVGERFAEITVGRVARECGARESLSSNALHKFGMEGGAAGTCSVNFQSVRANSSFKCCFKPAPYFSSASANSTKVRK